MGPENIYTSAEYLEATSGTWHAEDSPWKAAQVSEMLHRHRLRPGVVGEVGCGSGRVLHELSKMPELAETQFEGYDISGQAIAMAGDLETPANVRFHHGSPFDSDTPAFDLLLALDVFEHVPDYLGFLESCQRRATHKLYHVPLDIYVSSVLRNAFISNRDRVGHLHYFTAETALATLRDTGHDIVDFFYTDGAVATFGHNRSAKRAIGNVPRRLFSRLDVGLTARVFGGFSLLVLAR